MSAASARPIHGACLNRLPPAKNRARPSAQTAMPSGPQGSSVTKQLRASTGSGNEARELAGDVGDRVRGDVVEPDGEAVVAGERVAVGAVAGCPAGRGGGPGRRRGAGM